MNVIIYVCAWFGPEIADTTFNVFLNCSVDETLKNVLSKKFQ